MALVANTKNTNDNLANTVADRRDIALLATATLCANVGTPITPGAATTAIAAIPVPFRCSVQMIQVACVSSAGGASRPTFNVAATVLAANLIASAVTLVSGDIVKATATTSPALLNKDLASGEMLTLNLTTAASEVVTGLSVVITVHVTDFVNAASTYD